MSRQPSRMVLALLALAGCAQTPPPEAAPEAAQPSSARPSSIVISDDARCFVIEREAPQAGGLAIPRQIVCPLVPPDSTRQH